MDGIEETKAVLFKWCGFMGFKPYAKPSPVTVRGSNYSRHNNPLTGLRVKTAILTGEYF
jgi:hypothetical protein